MSKINFVIGLTDVEDYDGFVYGDVGTPHSDFTRVNYNIKKASTEIEKATLTWALDMSLDVTKNVIKVWEHIIRRPHLNMINITETKNIQVLGYNHYDLNAAFINLIPLLLEYKIQLTDNDYTNGMIEATEFGDMTIDFQQINDESGIRHQELLVHAYHHNTIDFLKKHDYPYVLPIFGFDFRIMHRRVINNTHRKQDYNFVEWVNKNKDALAEKGYTLDDPYCNTGVIRIGKLIGDSLEEYQKLQKYSRICRTSMVKVEE